MGVKYDQGRAEQFRPYLQQLAGAPTFFETEWCELEESPGQRDYRAVDRALEKAYALGFRLYLKIRIGSCWATGGTALMSRGRKTASAPPVDLDAYQSFVRDVVARYAPLGVSGYAIENEPNAANFWQGDAAQYEQLVRLGAEAVRAADSDAAVFDGGISSTAYGVAIADRLLRLGRPDEALAAYQRYYERRFAERAADFPPVATVEELGAALSSPHSQRNLEMLAATSRLANEGVVAAYQLHFYERWDNIPAVLDYVRSILPADMPIETWELGLYWPGEGDRQALASETTKAVALFLGGGVRRVIFLPTASSPGGRRPIEQRWGLLEPDGQVRPHGVVYQGLAAATAAPGAAWRPIARGGVNGLALTNDQESLAVLWSEEGARVSGPPPSESAQARTMEGALQPWGPGGLTVDSAPVVVTLPGGEDPQELVLGTR